MVYSSSLGTSKNFNFKAGLFHRTEDSRQPGFGTASSGCNCRFLLYYGKIALL
jgi:hypothetical protein